MNCIQLHRYCLPSMVAGLLGALLLASAPAATAKPQAGGVSPGDIVETNINYQPVTGEVLRSYGNTADLNLGQNNVGRYLEVQYMKVVQKAGSGGSSQFAPGDTVQRSDRGNTVTGKIMKTNGAYCEIDSSGSGFTGWGKCSQMRLISKASPAASAAATASALGLPPTHTASLTIVPGIKSAPGAVNPAGNHGFYLLKDPADQALSKGGFHAPAGVNPLKAFNTACEKNAPECRTAVAAIIGDSATAGKTDAGGNATLPPVPPGVYYLFGLGQYEGKPLVWDVKVQVKSGANSITLDQHNGTVPE
jgi:hypothetical protein